MDISNDFSIDYDSWWLIDIDNICDFYKYLMKKLDIK